MKEKPILFNGEMVRAILDGKKTQTRRVIKPQPVLVGERWEWTPRGKVVHSSDWFVDREPSPFMLCGAPYQIGDRLWVKETFVLETITNVGELPTDGRPYEYIESNYDEDYYWLVPHYRATEPEPHIVPDDLEDSYDDRTRWSPSIFMPKWATRIWLEVTDKRAERVQDISEEDARAEGAEPVMKDSGGFEPMGSPCPEIPHYGEGFAMLWDSIKHGYPFADNPWVFVYAFSHLTG